MLTLVPVLVVEVLVVVRMLALVSVVGLEVLVVVVELT